MNYLHRCSDIACASLFLTCSVSFAQAVLINCQTSACQKKKKKKKVSLLWLEDCVISVLGNLPALVEMEGEGAQILTAID